MIECNGYVIKYANKMWQITQLNIAAIVAEFKSLKDSLDYCKAS